MVKYHYFHWVNVIAAAHLLSLGMGCSRHHTADDETPFAAVTRLGLQPGWVHFKGPSGFTVDIPTGWSVKEGASRGAAEIVGPQEQRLVIWPLFFRGEVNPSAMQALCQSVTKLMCADGSWQTAEAVGNTALRVVGRCGPSDAVMLLGWVSSPQGTSVLSALAQTPARNFPAQTETFATILQSWQVLGSPGAEEVAASTSYFQWTEPKEQAFVLEVPAGWKIDGGLMRYAPLDTRKAWAATSPDNAVWLMGGDASLPMFMTRVPSAEAYYPEGSWYPGRYGSPGAQQFKVKRYQPAAEFLQEYVPAHFAAACTDIRLGDVVARPDLEQALWKAEYERYTSMYQIRLSQSEVHFTCQRDGRRLEGYALAGTTLVVTGAIANWFVETLFGYLAEPGKNVEAFSLLMHMASSMHLNPAWANMQSNIAKKSSEIFTAEQEAVGKIIKETYENRQRTGDEIDRRRSNAILGKVDVIDPATGTEYKVDSSSNYYWINNRGVIVGTEVNATPGLDFRTLLQRP